MDTRISLDGSITFTTGGKETTLTHAEALELASVIFDLELSDNVARELAGRGITPPDPDEDESARIAFDRHQTALEMECPTLCELAAREAAIVVSRSYPKG